MQEHGEPDHVMISDVVLATTQDVGQSVCTAAVEHSLVFMPI